MRSALSIVAVLGLAAGASGSVQVFMTAASQGYGLTDPSEALQVTRGNGMDLTPLNAPIFPPAYQPLATAAPGELVYVWLKFNNEPNNRRIIGLSWYGTDRVPDAVAFYKLDDAGPNGTYGTIRWDSRLECLDGSFEDNYFPAHAIYMFAVQTEGIVNRNFALHPYFDHTTRIALLGALRYDVPSPAGNPYTFGFADFVNTIEYFGEVPDPTVEWGELVVTPEPGTLAMLGLGSLLLRRRSGRRARAASSPAPAGTPTRRGPSLTRAAVLLLAALAPVAGANAYVAVYFTGASDGYGLTNPALAFTISGNDGYDGFNYVLADVDGSGGPSAGDVPPIQPVATVDPGETVYVWLRFVDEPNGRKIGGLSLKCEQDIPDAMAFYRLNSVESSGNIRWQSTDEQLTGLHYDPNNPWLPEGGVYLIGYTVSGIVNASAPFQELWVGGTAPNLTRTALLGAMRFDEPGDRTFWHAESYNTFDYVGEYPNPTVEFGAVHVTPEPASMMLLGLAGLFLRRR